MYMEELFFIGFGLFCWAGAIFNWNWFYSKLITRALEGVIGRKPMRIMFALMGALMIGMGIAGILGGSELFG